MSTPKISVITVSFQHADFIRQTIESVMLQRYDNIEHIVVDGGSTDGTIEILKEYPHLKWTSEPDRGQSHALNKGFAQATGDIIAWINSDDWYPPGVFKDVALALEEYPVVMGACEVCDRNGARQQVVKNYERTWFDLLKYWVFCASPAQPSVFFRRDLLEQVKYGPGQYFDEDLEFCMDLDLWLRMAERYPFARRLPKVLSFLRTYDTNKTGEMMDLTYREMSRVYERHVRRRILNETRMSVLVPVAQAGAELRATIDSMREQTAHAAELVVVDHGADPKLSKVLRRSVLEAARTVPQHIVRYVRVNPGSVFEGLTQALPSVRGRLVTVLQSGDRIPSGWVEACEKEFDRDNTAFAWLYDDSRNEREGFLARTDAGVSFRIDSAFAAPRLLPNFVARTIALHEVQGFKAHTRREGADGGPQRSDAPRISPILAIRQLMVRLLNKGWSVLGDHSLRIPQCHPALVETEALLPLFHVYSNAQLVCDLEDEYQAEPFAQERRQHGFMIRLPDQIVESAKRLLAHTPSRWMDVVDDAQDHVRLDQWASAYPFFLPAWILLQQCAAANGDSAMLQRTKEGIAKAEQFLASC